MLTSYWQQLRQRFAKHPSNKTELIALLHETMQHQLINPDALTMIESVLEVNDRHVREIMIPRSQMVVLQQDQPFNELLPIITKTAHSRFPVIGKNHDDIVGILLAKDLLALIQEANPERFTPKQFLHPALFIPESKRLDHLLREFQSKHLHMAIVVDEYSNTSGLVTIEDVLEQIVGNIEDEYDEVDPAYIQPQGKHFLVQALTPIEQINEHFALNWSNKDFSTIGGLVAQRFGHMPKKGESIKIEPFNIVVKSAEKRRLQLLELQRLTATKNKHATKATS